MDVGGHDGSDFNAMLQRGNELFDSDQKSALAAYYQVVTLQPGHVEAWNQIGRLLFDLGQYREAEMVFRRVEALSREQGLADWADMAAQNADLTRDTRLAQEAPAPSEEQQSIAAVSGIAEVAAPAVHEMAAGSAEPPAPEPAAALAAPAAEAMLPAAADWNATPPDVASLPTNLRIDEMQVSSIMGRIEAASQQQPAAVQQPPQAAAASFVPQPHQAMPQQPFQPAQAHHPAYGQGPGQALPPLSRLDGLSAWPGPAANLIGAQTQQDASAQAAMLAPGSSGPTGFAGQQTVPGQMAQTAPPQQQRPPLPQQGGPQAHGHGQMPPGYAPPSQGAPGTQAGAMHRHHLPPLPQGPAGTHPAAAHPGAPFAAAGHRSPLPVAGEAEPQPKGRSGRLALIGLGVIGAVGIGVGTTFFMQQGDPAAGDIPIVKSDEKIAGPQKPAAIAEPSAAAETTAAAPTPQTSDRDQAYTTGMNHLVNGRYEEGRQFLERAHELGHAEASYNLASMYAKGDGVTQDFARVVAYLEKSVEGGYAPAMTNLGLLYANGEGVGQDFPRARALWEKAAAGEHPDAMHNLAVVFATGKGVDKNMTEAISWYRKAVNAGFVESMANLGLVYANGDGVAQDFGEAKRLWEMAAAKGHEIAAQNLVKLNQILEQQKGQPASQ